MSKFEFENEQEIIEYLKKEFCITEKHAEEVIKDIINIENNEYTDFYEEQQETCVDCDISYRLRKCTYCQELVCSKDRTYCKKCGSLLCDKCISDCTYCYVKC